MSSHSPLFPLSPALHNHWAIFSLYEFCLFWKFYIKGIGGYVVFCIYNVFEVRPCYSLCQCFVAPCGRAIFHCVALSHCVGLFISWWTFGLLPALLLWTGVSRFLSRCTFSVLWGLHLGVDLQGRMVSPCWTFWEIAGLFSRLAAPFYIPARRVRRFLFLHVLASTWCYWLFDTGFLNTRLMVIHSVA